MIPKPKEEEPIPAEFKHNLEFSLLGRTFSLSFQVNKKQE